MSRSPLTIALAAAGVVLAAPALAASPPTPVARTAASKTTLQVRTGALGTYVVDASGRSLYMFTKDTARKSACTGACAKTWPPYLTSGKPTAGSGVSGSKVGTLKRGNGSMQVTYYGHPLYRYAADTAKGQTRGEGVGSLWYLVTPTGKKLINPAASPSPAPTTPTTGGGYSY